MSHEGEENVIYMRVRTYVFWVEIACDGKTTGKKNIKKKYHQRKPPADVTIEFEPHFLVLFLLLLLFFNQIIIPNEFPNTLYVTP